MTGRCLIATYRGLDIASKPDGGIHEFTKIPDTELGVFSDWAYDNRRLIAAFRNNTSI
jgi:hypothetical protein